MKEKDAQKSNVEKYLSSDENVGNVNYISYTSQVQIGCTVCESFCIFADPCCPILAEHCMKGS